MVLLQLNDWFLVPDGDGLGAGRTLRWLEARCLNNILCSYKKDTKNKSLNISYFWNWARALHVFRLHDKIFVFEQVVVAFAHEIKNFAVKSGVVRVANNGAPGTAIRRAATPLAALANAVRIPNHFYLYSGKK